MKTALFLDIMLCGLSPWYQFLEESVASICVGLKNVSTMKREAVGFFKTIHIYRFLQRHILEEENCYLLFSIQSGHIQILVISYISEIVSHTMLFQTSR